MSRISTYRPLILGAIAASALLAGCATQPRLQGHTDIPATHSGRTLAAELPDAIRVPGAIAAAGEALLSRGYTIENRQVTADYGRIIARRPSAPAPERVVIYSQLTPRAVGLTITLEPFGDEVAARAILDDTLARLAL